MLYARTLRLDQLLEFLTHTPHKLRPIVSPVELANHITPPPLPPNPTPPGCHRRFTIDVSHMRRSLRYAAEGLFHFPRVAPSLRLNDSGCFISALLSLLCS